MSKPTVAALAVRVAELEDRLLIMAQSHNEAIAELFERIAEFEAKLEAPKAAAPTNGDGAPPALVIHQYGEATRYRLVGVARTVQAAKALLPQGGKVRPWANGFAAYAR